MWRAIPANRWYSGRSGGTIRRRDLAAAGTRRRPVALPFRLCGLAGARAGVAAARPPVRLPRPSARRPLASTSDCALRRRRDCADAGRGPGAVPLDGRHRRARRLWRADVRRGARRRHRVAEAVHEARRRDRHRVDLLVLRLPPQLDDVADARHDADARLGRRHDQRVQPARQHGRPVRRCRPHRRRCAAVRPAARAAGRARLR